MANDEKCIFCNIALGKVKSRKVFEDDVICAFLDINPANPGHVLIIPKEHYQILPMVPSDVIGHMFNIAKKISMVMFSEIGSEGTSYFVANGMSAGQKAPHVMMHVIARFEKDMVGLAPETFEVSDDDINKIEAKLKESLIKVFEGRGVVAKKAFDKEEVSEVVDTPKDKESSGNTEHDDTNTKGSKGDKTPDDKSDSGEEKGSGDGIDDNENDSDSSNEELDDKSTDEGLEAKFENKSKKEKEIDIDKIANMFLK